MNSSIEVANAAAKAAYRNLLRAVRNHVGKEDHKSHFTDFIKHEFRRNVSSQNPPNLKLAQDYTFYLNSVHHQKDCRSLLSSKAWHLEKAHGFNFFPGTQSIEVLAVFKRGSGVKIKRKKSGKKKSLA